MNDTVKEESQTLPVDWDTDEIVARRDQYYAASQRKFVPYHTPLIFKRGQKQYLWDENDTRYIDLLAMNVCVSVGHAHPAVVKAASEQMAALTHCTTMFYHPVPAHYAEELISTLPAVDDTDDAWVVHFTNSGAEAIDLALMMARTYTGRNDMLALRNSYHGATYGAQSVTGISGFRHNVAPLGGVSFVPEPNTYRGLFGDDVTQYLDEIEQTLNTSTTGQAAGIIIEPIQGYGGIVPMPTGYIKGAFERVRATGGLGIIDEVQSGVGRTGDHFWSFEGHDVIPDIIVMAKGIGNGFPLGAVVAKRSIGECMAEKFLFHTYGANPVASAVGRAVLRVIQDEDLQTNARVTGKLLKDRLLALQERYPAIGDVRGCGLMLAIEIVKDPKNRTPDPDLTAAIFEKTRDHGIVVSKSGPHRSILRMVPPLCLSAADVDPVADALDACFAELCP